MNSVSQQPDLISAIPPRLNQTSKWQSNDAAPFKSAYSPPSAFTTNHLQGRAFQPISFQCLGSASSNMLVTTGGINSNLKYFKTNEKFVLSVIYN